MQQWLSNWLFPVECLGGCGQFDQWLCATCAERAFQPRCITGVQLNFPLIRYVMSLGEYSNPLLRRTIVELKYSGYYKVAAVLGNALHRVINNYRYDYCVPVPLHKHRLRERGFNQTQLIAQRLAIPVLPALTKIRSTARQATLNRSGRLTNLTNAFAVSEKIRSKLSQKHILLIDDVLSTGTTAQTCAQLLNLAGCSVIDVAVIAMNVEEYTEKYT